MRNIKKTILVTGGSRGIGLAITKELLKKKNLIYLNYKSNTLQLSKFLKTNKSQIIPLKANLSLKKEVFRLVKKILNDNNFPDVIINNAGIAPSAPISFTSSKWVEQWDKTLDVNLKAPALICKSFIEQKINMKINKKLRIINISSRAAFRGETKDFIPYAASKGGLISLTKTIAKSFGKDGILSFSIAPGFVKTEMADEFINKYSLNHAMEGIVLDRLTEAEDVAPVVSFIASGKLDHATGSTIDINGGSYLR
tara:strand:+ start:25 stop:786 length:762 start_codon:yes stop_codon:yes gene_type:complete